MMGETFGSLGIAHHIMHEITAERHKEMCHFLITFPCRSIELTPAVIHDACCYVTHPGLDAVYTLAIVTKLPIREFVAIVLSSCCSCGFSSLNDRISGTPSLCCPMGKLDGF